MGAYLSALNEIEAYISDGGGNTIELILAEIARLRAIAIGQGGSE